MEPIFKETEKNGIYEASLFSIINGMHIENKVEIDLKRSRQDDIQKLLKQGLDLKIIDEILNGKLEKNKKNAIAYLYKEHLKRIEYENKYGVGENSSKNK
jgi:hypothetical protein